jgi:hypothetical protein
MDWHRMGEINLGVMGPGLLAKPVVFGTAREVMSVRSRRPGYVRLMLEIPIARRIQGFLRGAAEDDAWRTGGLCGSWRTGGVIKRGVVLRMSVELKQEVEEYAAEAEQVQARFFWRASHYSSASMSEWIQKYGATMGLGRGGDNP